MKKTILSVTFLLGTLLSYSQSPHLQWAKNIGTNGTSGDAFVNSIATDATGNVYTTGFFTGTVDFDPGAGVFNMTANGIDITFVSKMDAAGNFLWAKSIPGNSNNNEGNTVAIDTTGNVYVSGYFSNTVYFGAAQTDSLVSAGSTDVFILKLDAAGNFLWAKSMGGTKEDVPNAMVLDAAGNVYITGTYEGTADFDPSAATAALTSAGNTDAFVAKLSPAGDYMWAYTMGGTGFDYGNGIALDTLGNVYTIGEFDATIVFNAGPNQKSLTPIGDYDVFISKYDNNGVFIWAKGVGGDKKDDGLSIAVDKSGNIYYVGDFIDTININPYSGAPFNLFVPLIAPHAQKGIFVSKLDTAGNYVWAKSISTNDNNYHGYPLALDGLGGVYLGGYFTDTLHIAIGADTLNYLSFNNDEGAFITKLDTGGNLLWARDFVGNSSVAANAIAADAASNIYIAGNFDGTANFDPDSSGVYNLTTSSGSDIFIMKLNPNIEGIVETSSIDNRITVYPNPTNGLFNIMIAKPTDNMHLAIYNSLGAMVYDQTTASGLNTVDLANQASGLYFVRVSSNNGLMATQKIIKR